METTTKEEVLFEKPANLFRGIEAVGGKLVITPNYLSFKPHLLNIQSQPLDIKIKDIKVIEPRKTLKFVPNGITITLHSGEEYKFVISERQQFIAYINNQIAG